MSKINSHRHDMPAVVTSTVVNDDSEMPRNGLWKYKQNYKSEQQSVYEISLLY